MGKAAAMAGESSPLVYEGRAIDHSQFKSSVWSVVFLSRLDTHWSCYDTADSVVHATLRYMMCDRRRAQRPTAE